MASSFNVNEYGDKLPDTLPDESREAYEQHGYKLLTVAAKTRSFDVVDKLLERGARPSSFTLCYYLQWYPDEQARYAKALFQHIDTDNPRIFEDGSSTLMGIYSTPGVLELVYPYAPLTLSNPLHSGLIPLNRCLFILPQLTDQDRVEEELVHSIISSRTPVGKALYDAIPKTRRVKDAIWLHPMTWVDAEWAPKIAPTDNPRYLEAIAMVREGRYRELDRNLGKEFLDLFPPLVRFGLTCFIRAPTVRVDTYFAIDRVRDLLVFTGLYCSYDSWAGRHACHLGFTLFEGADD